MDGIMCALTAVGGLGWKAHGFIRGMQNPSNNENNAFRTKQCYNEPRWRKPSYLTVNSKHETSLVAVGNTETLNACGELIRRQAVSAAGALLVEARTPSDLSVGFSAPQKPSVLSPFKAC